MNLYKLLSHKITVGISGIFNVEKNCRYFWRNEQ